MIGTLLVGLHLRHGISSGFQSLGLDHPVYTRRLTTWGVVLAVIIGGGLALIPIGVCDPVMRVSSSRATRYLLWLSTRKFPAARLPTNGTAIGSNRSW